MPITIPEISEILGEGATVFDSYAFALKFLEKFSIMLSKRYAFNYINDVDATEAGLLVKIIKNHNTLYDICRKGNDYRAGCIICRSIADSTAIVKLVYMNDNKEEREYRHYLYLLDGFRVRLALLKNDALKNDGRISKGEYDTLVKKISDATINTSSSIRVCEQKLNDHPYAKMYPDFHTLATSKAAWQFKKVGNIGQKGKNVSQYKWEDLYELLDPRPTIVSAYSKYLSQHIHGLSISSLDGVENIDNFESLLSFGSSLQIPLSKELRSRYNRSNELAKYFTNSDIEYLFSMYSPSRKNALINMLRNMS